MKKQLRMSSLIFLSVSAILWNGCTGSFHSKNCPYYSGCDSDYSCYNVETSETCPASSEVFYESISPENKATYSTSMRESTYTRSQTDSAYPMSTSDSAYSKSGNEFSSSNSTFTADRTKSTNTSGSSQTWSEPAYSKTISESTYTKSQTDSALPQSTTNYAKSGNNSTSSTTGLTSDFTKSTSTSGSSQTWSEPTYSKTISESTYTKSQTDSASPKSTTNYAKSGNNSSSSNTGLTTDFTKSSKATDSSQTSQTWKEPAYSQAISESTYSTKSKTDAAYPKSTSNSTYYKSENDSTTSYVTDAKSTSSSDFSTKGNSLTNNSASYKDASSNNYVDAFGYTDASSKNEPVMKGCKYGPTCEASTGVTVTARSPKTTLKDDQYAVDYDVTANADVRDVSLTAKLSDAATYISSQPEAKVSGRELTWDLGTLTKGQNLKGKILFKSTKEGELTTCFTIKASADACCSTLCTKPVLSCEKTAPEEVKLGDQMNYSVTVKNTGSSAAENVVLNITDPTKPLNFKIGTIEAGQSKKVTFSYPADKRGKACYTAVATSSNAKQTSCDLCTLVTSCTSECRKTGPKDALIGQTITYQITVSNTGDKTLHDLVITDTAPPATTIVAAADADISGKKAVWKINELKAGDKSTFNIALTNRTTGTFAANTTVTNREGSNSTAEASTRWKGRAALDVSTSTSENSLFVGGTSRYKVSVTNQGQEADTNVNVAVIFPAGIEPLNTSGGSVGKIDGQTVKFAPYPKLNPRQSIEFYVTVKANSSGDLRPKIQVGSDSIKPPITQEESLIVN